MKLMMNKYNIIVLILIIKKFILSISYYSYIFAISLFCYNNKCPTQADKTVNGIRRLEYYVH